MGERFRGGVLLLLVACSPGPTDEPPGAARLGGADAAPISGSPAGPSGSGAPASAPVPASLPSQPCGDGTCDEPEQADPSLCPRDCQEQPSTGEDWCGDGVCDALEEAESSCAADCEAVAAAKAAAAAARAARAAADPDVISSGLAPAPGKVVDPPPPALSPPLDHSADAPATDPAPEPQPAPEAPTASGSGLSAQPR